MLRACDKIICLPAACMRKQPVCVHVKTELSFSRPCVYIIVHAFRFSFKRFWEKMHSKKELKAKWRSPLLYPFPLHIEFEENCGFHCDWCNRQCWSDIKNQAIQFYVQMADEDGYVSSRSNLLVALSTMLCPLTPLLKDVILLY